ncbi:hypothetical protein MPSEU_000909600 [Mayamaea pseudoterrestris]|nr:hypothetical protein MPSEU_000909600 [Mayamaea pseudoterrestris]
MTLMLSTHWNRQLRNDDGRRFTMRFMHQKTLTMRLFFSGLMAWLILILQQRVWGSSILHDDDDYELEYPNFDVWTMFLYFVGVVLALLLVAMIHVSYWNHCSRCEDDDDEQTNIDAATFANNPCDDTVAMSDVDDKEGFAMDDSDDDEGDDDGNEDATAAAAGDVEKGSDSSNGGVKEVPVAAVNSSAELPV